MKIVKVSLNLSTEAVRIVRNLANSRGTTMTDVIRHAIGNEKFLADAVKAGGKIVIVDKRGKMSQVVFR